MSKFDGDIISAEFTAAFVCENIEVALLTKIKCPGYFRCHWIAAAKAKYHKESDIKEAEYFSTEDFLDSLNKLLVYTADLSKLFDMDRIDDVSKTLETQIQTFLLASNDIGYYRKWGFQSWLGKVEKLRKNNFEKDFQKLLETQFKFSLAEINELNNFSTMKSFTDIIKSKLEKK